ncbi:hypothetical protein TVAG_403640 [Trichomonas vaginalis G3]|uniref:Uncharacterized protein n=1 Tax=Trichomonas vaginalis (strain ATCC PRA-98 / G3) TaxID=412133 RepID=A2ELP2_TRIV3|nr:hypothetical protein TVAGG3_0894910 [Trichomonas vaginalis G3]EAY06407.1 hypothetical protein TVAG_403640 [Trichomonas vaginalis G3]KAI5502995.1 hypothetical protein TVAGG3_0894910 [Trichomonas vaginalis G3]|eukprot:XP_001318630.1 hypothetical protein [Trichomonas vaginalis G3]
MNKPDLSITISKENVPRNSTITITGAFTDLDNGKSLYLLYQLIKDTTVIKQATLKTYSSNGNENQAISESISIDSDAELGEYSLRFIMSSVDNFDGESGNSFSLSDPVTKQIGVILVPTISLTSTTDAYYQKGSTLHSSGAFTSETDVMISYFFNSEAPKDLGRVEKAKEKFSFDISIPDTLTHGSHVLNIVASDDNLYSSEPTSLNFNIWNKPHLLKAELKEEKYKAGDLIIISGKVQDIDNHDKLQFFVSFNEGDVKKEYEYTSNGKEEDYNFNITTPSDLKDGDVNITVYILDQDKLQSEKSTMSFKFYTEKTNSNTNDSNKDKKKKTVIAVVVVIVCIILIAIIVFIVIKKLKSSNDASSDSPDSQRMPEYELKDEETIIGDGENPQANTTMDNPMYVSSNPQTNDPFDDMDD